MLHTKFQAPEPSGSKEVDFFKSTSMHFYDSNLGPPGSGPSWTLGPSLNKFGKGPSGNVTYQISSTCAKQFWRRRFLSIFHF